MHNMNYNAQIYGLVYKTMQMHVTGYNFHTHPLQPQIVNVESAGALV